MRVAYAGGAPFAVLVLERLLASRHEVVVCLTTPDKPRGRHGTPQPSPLKTAALAAGLPVLQPETLREAEAQDALLGHRPDILVACAYGRIVPASLLQRLAAVVVHPSDVPRWRGAAPVARALMAGETALSVTTLRMTAGIDEGPVAERRVVDVPADADAGQAYGLLAGPAAEGLVATLDAIEAGTVVWRDQEGVATYAAKLTEADRVIDWRLPAAAIADQVRALSPAVGAYTDLGGRRVLVWKARPLAAGELPESEADRLIVACGDGALELLEVQEAGRRRMTSAEYLRGAGRRLLDSR